MEKLITILIQRAYRYYKENYYQLIKEKFPFLQQSKLTNTFLVSLHNSFISFIGWDFNYDRFGSAFSRQLTYFDELTIYQHSIRLNRHFLLNLMGYRLPSTHSLAKQFTFNKFTETIAEEVAHCLVREFYPDAEEHGSEFKEIKTTLKKYLQTEPVIELLSKKLNNR